MDKVKVNIKKAVYDLKEKVNPKPYFSEDEVYIILNIIRPRAIIKDLLKRDMNGKYKYTKREIADKHMLPLSNVSKLCNLYRYKKIF